MLGFREFTSSAELNAHYREVRKRTEAWRPPAKPEPRPSPVPEAPPPAPVAERVLQASWPSTVPTGRVLHVPPLQPAEPETPKIAIHAIKLAVLKHFDHLTIFDLDSARRTANVVRPRQIAMYLCKKLTTRSLPEIGRKFGNRDHTTVLHAVRRITEKRAADPDFDAAITALEEQLLAEHGGRRVWLTPEQPVSSAPTTATEEDQHGQEQAAIERA